VRLTPAAAARWGARALRGLARRLERFGSSDAARMDSFMASWDMVAEPDEHFYLAQYWHRLEPVLRRLPDDARILDVGCGQGRLTLPVADSLPRATVVGVDVSQRALAAARQHAAVRRIENVEFRTADGVAFLSKEPDSSAGLVLFVEVTQWMEHYREALAEIVRVLEPGGSLFAALRSQHYQLLKEVQEGRLDEARTVRDARSSQLGDLAVRFNWHTVEDLRALFGELRLEIEGLYAIGILSGTHADPLSTIAQPSRLSGRARAQLLDLEISLAEQYAGCGRYIGVLATKK
jgi:SAM-dependent methyltransferase